MNKLDIEISTTMTCKMCKHYNRDYDICTVCSTKPCPTGDAKTCTYFKMNLLK